MAAGMIGRGSFLIQKLNADMKWVGALGALPTQMQNWADTGRAADPNKQKTNKCAVRLGRSIEVVLMYHSVQIMQLLFMQSISPPRIRGHITLGHSLTMDSTADMLSVGLRLGF